MALRFFTLILLLCSSFAHAGLFDSPAGKSRFVPVDQAFSFDFQQQGNQLTLNWQIKPGYYLYRQQLHLEPVQATFAPLTLPAGKMHEDEFYGKSAIFTEALTIPVTLTHTAQDASLRVTYQGCAESGFCYPPETRNVPLSLITATATPVANPATASQAQAAVPQLPFSVLWALLIGIGVAFTPCVLPMYPLIASLVLGRQNALSTSRSLWLAVVYVQGMALTYTLLGLIVAAAGLPFQAALQHPYVLSGLSVLFVLLALSMFGVYNLQLPSALQTRLALLSNHQQGGSVAGVFLMGAIAGLICSPCTTAPLSAILLYIAQSGNLTTGGLTLWLYACGMGIPLILVTVFGQRLLPKSGPWMEQVKTAFGFIILALPVFLMTRVLGEVWGLRLWSGLAIAFFSWAFITTLSAQKKRWRLVQIILLAAALISARPLQDWVFGTPSPQAVSQLAFTRITTTESLRSAIAQAKGKPVMLDLYADWCVACKEFEKYTFSDPQIAAALKDTTLLQADVTANSPQDKALLSELQILGLPTILFFDKNGKELTNQRVTGFMDASRFARHLHNRSL